MNYRLPEVEHWMFEEALPLWSTMGRNPDGFGFVEQMDLNGKPLDVGFTRMRVQARQIYTFCHAAELGWQGQALKSASDGIDFITTHAWLPEGGWARRLSPKGEILDQTLEAYEQAFVLFAFGWYYKATGDKAVLELSHKTIDTMYKRLTQPQGLGFMAEAPLCDNLLQNPHMHYLEAMLVWYQASGDSRFRDEARKIVELLQRYFVRSDVLIEYFDHDWHPAEGNKGRIVEPGHHFEWTWLLYQYRKIIGDDVSPIARRLFNFAEAHGSDARGVVFDAVLDDGSVLRADHRTWPQTEALKAHIAMAEFEQLDNGIRIAQLVNILLDRYLATIPHGIWVDHLDKNLQPLVQTVPASTLYHVFLAFAELQRWQHSIA